MYSDCLTQIADAWLLVRPPDILVGGLGFYRDSSVYLLLSFSLFRQRPRELAERNSTTLFRRLRNLTASLTAYIFRKKLKEDSRQVR